MQVSLQPDSQTYQFAEAYKNYYVGCLLPYSESNGTNYRTRSGKQDRWGGGLSNGAGGTMVYLIGLMVITRRARYCVHFSSEKGFYRGSMTGFASRRHSHPRAFCVEFERRSGQLEYVFLVHV